MSKFRNLVGSLGLIGVLSGSANATESIISYLVDRNFQKEIIDYGDAVVLFYGSQPLSEEARIQMNFLKNGFERIAEKSQELFVNGHKVKFGEYDMQQHALLGISREEANQLILEKYGIKNWPVIVLYKNGEIIDSYPCKPNDQGSSDAMVHNMLGGWLPSFYVGPVDGEIYAYEGTCKLHPLE